MNSACCKKFVENTLVSVVRKENEYNNFYSKNKNRNSKVNSTTKLHSLTQQRLSPKSSCILSILHEKAYGG